MSSSNEQKIREQYQKHLDEFNMIKEALRQTLQNASILFYQQTKFKVSIPEPRLKTVDSTIGKIKRKQINRDELFVYDNDTLSLIVNDFLGARITCNTKEDVQLMCDLLCQQPRLSLVKNDPLEKDSGYRAIHLDMKYQVHFQDKLLNIPEIGRASCRERV